MKLYKMIIAATAVMAAAACQKQEQENNNDEPAAQAFGRLSVSLAPTVSVSTKASYTTLEDAEKAIKSAQLVICKQDGSVARYISKTNPGPGPVVFDGMSLPVGTYRVHAILNGKNLENCLSESEILQPVYHLVDNADGFVQYASAGCTVEEDRNTDCQLQAARLVARVHVQSIKNNLPPAYGSMTIKNVFLENAVNDENLGKTAFPYCINPFGRSSEDDEDSIIDGVTNLAEAPAFTFKDISSSVPNKSVYNSAFNLYCYENECEYDPDYAFDASAYQATKLVVAVEIRGRIYYYPLFVSETGAVEANKSYSLAITLNNIGSEDPSVPLILSAASVSVSVAEWADGGSQDVQM